MLYLKMTTRKKKEGREGGMNREKEGGMEGRRGGGKEGGTEGGRKEDDTALSSLEVSHRPL